MKFTYYYLAFTLILQTLNHADCGAQTEKLIKYGTDQSVMFGKYLEESEDEVSFFIISETFDANDDAIMIDEAQNQKSVALDYNMAQDNISAEAEGEYPYSTSHLFQLNDDEYIGVIIRDLTLPHQLSTGGGSVSGTRRCKAIGLAKYNSSTELLTTFLDTLCNTSYILSAFEEDGIVHVAYLNSSNKVEILSVDTSFSTSSRFAMNSAAWHATPSSNSDGFYIYPFNGSNYDECELVHVQLDETETILSDFIDVSISERDKAAKLHYTDSAVFVFLSSHDPSNNVIKKFAMDGTEITSESIPMILFDWKFIEGDILLFLQDNDLSTSNPITVASFDNDLVGIYSESYGFSAVKMTDLVIDETNAEFKITGHTALHYLDSANRDTNKLYYLNDSYTKFLSAEEESEISDSFYFPNPSNQVKAHLRFSDYDIELDEAVEIFFVDLNGRVVKPSFKIISNNLIEINTSNLSKGTYIGSATLDGEIITNGKIVIE